MRNPYSNPHTRYEINLAPLPRLFVLVLLMLTAGTLIGTIYLTATQPEIPPISNLWKAPRVHITLPSVRSIIQSEIDAHNPFANLKGGR